MSENCRSHGGDFFDSHCISTTANLL